MNKLITLLDAYDKAVAASEAAWVSAGREPDDTAATTACEKAAEASDLCLLEAANELVRIEPTLALNSAELMILTNRKFLRRKYAALEA